MGTQKIQIHRSSQYPYTAGGGGPILPPGYDQCAHARLTRYARRALVGRLNRLPTWLDKTE